MEKNKKSSWFLYALVFVGILIFDAMTKSYFAKNMQLGESWPVIKGFFHLTLVHNYGAAFGIGSAWPKWIFHVSSFGALFILAYMFYTLKEKSWCVKWAAVLIFSGALGNLVDRVRLGYVVDFLDVFIKTHHWPAFNVADSAICIGATLFAIDALFIQSKTEQA